LGHEWDTTSGEHYHRPTLRLLGIRIGDDDARRLIATLLAQGARTG
jgi:hypothetical protein